MALFGSRIASLDLGGDTTRSLLRPLMGPGETIVALGEGRLLVTGMGEAGGSFVSVWDPATDALDQSRIEGSIHALRAAEEKIYVSHSSGLGAFLSVIEVGEREGELRLQQQSFPVSASPSALALGDGRALLGSLAGDVVVLSEGLEIEGLRLDAPIDAVGTLASFFWATHPSPFGDLTLVPMHDLSRGAARRYEGLYFAGLGACE